MILREFGRARRGAVSVMFAAAAVPMLGLVGLAVDYGIWNQANSGLALAANVAALTAVKVAANAQLATDPNAQTEGRNAGTQWFLAEVGSTSQTVVGTTNVTLASGYPNVSVTMGATVTATVTYSGTVKSLFGGMLFHVLSYPISGEASASIASAPYLNVELLLDNSSSMQIGATTADQATMMALTPCDPYNWYNGSGYQVAQDAFGNYAYNVPGYPPYDGGIQNNANNYTGITASSEFNGATMLVPQNIGAWEGPSCDPLLTSPYKGTGIQAGPPCAFACHWDTAGGPGGNNSSTSKDLYGTARKYGVTIRFDLLKNAVQTIITAMQNDDEAIHNLNIGIFTFNTGVTQIYPANGSEAGDSWSTASSLVGYPPASVGAQETGIIPVVGSLGTVNGQLVNNDNTAFTESMTTLQSQYLRTAAGNGTVATAPRKVLMIITDGFLDDPNNGQRSAFPSSACNGFKNLGYTVYVIYTPYYPLMLINYFQSQWYTIVEGTGPTSISYNLQQCASSQSDYISATSQTDLNNALALFLKSALNQPARFVM